jgi:ubiquinol-cytochrome c reductase subunit 7
MALGYSLAGWIKSSRTLSKYVKPVANWYADLAGYRQMGLKYDDLCACHDIVALVHGIKEMP